MKLQLRHLKRELGSAATFDFLQGAIDWDPTHVDADLLALFGSGPYFGWWSVHHPDGSSLNKPSDYHAELPEAREHYHLQYKGVEEAMNKVEEYIASRGPFDVLVGFSQGAVATLRSHVLPPRLSAVRILWGLCGRCDTGVDLDGPHPRERAGGWARA